MEIRNATPKDHDDICRIAKQTIYNKSFSNRLMFSSDDAYAKGWIQVYCESGQIKGFTCRRDKVRSKETMVYFVGVDQECQGRKIGSLLMEHLHKTCQHPTVVLHVEKTNVRALPFYTRIGYAIRMCTADGKAWTLFNDNCKG